MSISFTYWFFRTLPVRLNRVGRLAETGIVSHSESQAVGVCALHTSGMCFSESAFWTQNMGWIS